MLCSLMCQGKEVPSSSHLQVGRVLLPDDLYTDPRMLSLENLSCKTKPETMRLWVKHFAPLGSVGGTEIPKSWFDFFTLNLLQPERFTWTKASLDSPAWKIIVDDRISETCLSFSIPKACPTSSPLTCSLSQQVIDHNNVILLDASFDDSGSPAILATATNSSTETPENHLSYEVMTNISTGSKRKLSKAPLLDTEVRSERIKRINKASRPQLARAKLASVAALRHPLYPLMPSAT
jgi:hypothetical protein